MADPARAHPKGRLLLTFCAVAALGLAVAGCGSSGLSGVANLGGASKTALAPVSKETATIAFEPFTGMPGNIAHALAQEIAQIGTWEWDVPTGELTWTAEVYRIFGLDPERGPVTVDAYAERIHPDHVSATGCSRIRSIETMCTRILSIALEPHRNFTSNSRRRGSWPLASCVERFHTAVEQRRTAPPEGS